MKQKNTIMPARDKTGPLGQASRSGKRHGHCSENQANDFKTGFEHGLHLAKPRQCCKGSGKGNHHHEENRGGRCHHPQA